MDRSLWDISNRVQYVEGFPVLLKAMDGQEAASASRFDFARASSYKTTVKNWKAKRFAPIFPSLRCAIMLPDGRLLSEDQPIGIARNAYHGSRIYEEGRELRFRYFNSSELAILEVKRLFAKIGYNTRFSPNHFLWMKSWELEGALQCIFLRQIDVDILANKLRDIAKQFKIDLKIENWTASGDEHLLCLPKLRFFGEEHLSQLVGLKY